jgi:hypothetical protein
MLLATTDLDNYAIGATDGRIGPVDDVFFDDESWGVRYLVADAGAWLAGRKVLISPIAIGEPNRAMRVLPASLSRWQVKNSPDVDTSKPLTRRQESDHLRYYGYASYWGSTGLWGSGGHPRMMLPGYAAATPGPAAGAGSGPCPDESRLRSCKALTGCSIRAPDGEIGHVQGLLLDDETWAVCHLVVRTGNGWLGHELLVAPPWIQCGRWLDGRDAASVTRRALRDAHGNRVSLD